MTKRTGNKTGNDRSKLARALAARGRKLPDRERNMKVRGGKSEEHSRVSKKHNNSR
jgi:hypothetical protein